MKKALITIAGALLLVACGEVDQTRAGAKSDAPAHTGTGKAYVQSGWQQGDKASWESQLRARGQNGMNEYNRVN